MPLAQCTNNSAHTHAQCEFFAISVWIDELTVWLRQHPGRFDIGVPEHLMFVMQLDDFKHHSHFVFCSFGSYLICCSHVSPFDIGQRIFIEHTRATELQVFLLAARWPWDLGSCLGNLALATPWLDTIWLIVIVIDLDLTMALAMPMTMAMAMAIET